MLVWLGLRPSLPALRGAVAWLVARALWFLCTRGRAACYISTARCTVCWQLSIPLVDAGAPPVPGVSRTEAGQQDPGSQTSTDPAGRGAEPRRTMPDPRLMLLVCQTLMPDLGRTRPDAAPDAGRRPRAPAGSQPGLPAQGRFWARGGRRRVR